MARKMVNEYNLNMRVAKEIAYGWNSGIYGDIRAELKNRVLFLMKYTLYQEGTILNWEIDNSFLGVIRIENHLFEGERIILNDVIE